MKHITKGYVKVNDYYFDGLDNDPETDYNTDAWRRMVMCQEIGHIFGLGHVDEVFDNANEGTCMDYTDDPDGDGTLDDPSNVSPNAHDYEMLAIKYGHLDGADEEDDGGPGGGNNGGGNNGEAPGQDISQWGKAISTDGKGRPDLFELNLGNGNRLFTHVLWAN